MSTFTPHRSAAARLSTGFFDRRLPRCALCAAVLLALVGPVRAQSAGAPGGAAPPVLPSITVAGKIKPVQTMIDRKVYNVAGDIQGVTGSAADVLNTLPSVEVDAGGVVSLRGDSNVTILVDGKPSAQLSGANAGDALQQFAANDIERVEVMTSAPAEYRADGTGGVINIVTRKSRKNGASGTLLANVGNERRYVLGASGAYNAEALKLSGGFGLRQDDRERIVNSDVVALDANGRPAALSSNHVDEHTRRLVPSLKGGIDYQLNPDQSLAFDATLRERSGKRYADQQNASALGDGTPTAASRRHSDGHEWNLNGEQRLSFRQNIAGPEETLELALHRSTEKEEEGYAYLNTASLPAPGQSRDHLFLSHDFQTDDVSADYRKVLPGSQVVKLGVNVRRDDNGYVNGGDNVDPVSGQILPNPDLNNQFRYRQTVQAVYGAYEQMLGAWGVVAGVRMERTAAQGQQSTTLAGNRQDYSGVYPNLHLERALDDTSTLSFAYGRRLSRPDPDELNPFVDHQDIHNLRAGNPNLLAQQTQALELGYRVEGDQQNAGVTGYLRRNRNGFTSVTLLLAPDVLLTTSANLPVSTSGGLEFNADGSLTPTLSYRVSGNLFYNQIDASALGVAGLKSTTGLNVKASLDYRPTRADTAQLSLSRSDKRLTPQGYASAVNLVNVGYRRQLQPDLSLVLTVSDVFNGQRSERILDTPTLTQTYQRIQHGRIAYAGLVYLFGAPKKAKGAAFDYEQ